MPRNQSGNFLLQALLALTCIFAFMPFFASRLASRDMAAQMYSTTRQIDNAAAAARIFIRENAFALPYNETVVSGTQFTDLLEPYGLPLGFRPQTALGQNIALVIHKDSSQVSAYLKMTGGDLSGIQIAELVRRIGFYAAADDALVVAIALDDAYSDIVRRNDTDLGAGAFLTNLEMNGNSLTNVGDIIANSAGFDTGEITTLSLTGTENGRKAKNSIKNATADKAVFQSPDGESALSLTRGTLSVDSVDARTVAAFGDAGTFNANTASVYDFAMTAGRTSFTGPANWYVRGNVVSDKMNFSVERLEINSFLNAARGQDVYIDEDSLSYSSYSGISVASIATSNITMRDQTSDALSDGETGAVILDIRPAGTSVLPDAFVSTINNDTIAPLKSPSDSDNTTVTCGTLIADLGGSYNAKSLSQYIICQYYFWQRLERRIDIKQCMLDGGSNCD